MPIVDHEETITMVTWEMQNGNIKIPYVIYEYPDDYSLGTVYCYMVKDGKVHFPERKVYIPPPIQPQVLTQPPQQEVKLPEYEPRSQPTSTSLRVDPELPAGLQETRPDGT